MTSAFSWQNSYLPFPSNKVCLRPLSVSGGMGFDSRCDFAPSTVLLGFLLCCWTWAVSSKSFQCLCSCCGAAHQVLNMQYIKYPMDVLLLVTVTMLYLISP